jgi:hypothetical protein
MLYLAGLPQIAFPEPDRSMISAYFGAEKLEVAITTDRCAQGYEPELV